MKIWIDFINTPQVSFWIPFIKEFEKENHELLLTCRDSANTVGLLNLYNLKYTIIGKNAGKGRLQKAYLFTKRVLRLYSFMRKNKTDIAVSQSSFYQPIVAKLLRIPCLYTNDNEHAKGNIFGFWFADKVILPKAFDKNGFSAKWPLRSKVTFYPSVKEAIYLSQQTEIKTALNKIKKIIYFRPEPWSAQYYKGPLNFFDEILLRLSKEYKVVVLPRDKNQLDYYQQKKFSNIAVAEKPLALKEILADCKLFIGAGGSMTRELAVMGINVISIYQGEMLNVDKYLVDRGKLVVDPNITYEQIKATLTNSKTVENNLSVLEEGKASYKKIKDTIINLN